MQSPNDARRRCDEVETETQLLQLQHECRFSANIEYARLAIHVQNVDPLAICKRTNASALVTAIEYDNVENTEMILSFLSEQNEQRIRKQAQDREAYKTALQVCCYNDRSEHAELLLGRRFGVVDSNEISEGALELSATSGSLSMVEFFLDPSRRNRISPLEWVNATICSAQEGRGDIVTRLVEVLCKECNQTWDRIQSPNQLVLLCAAGKAEEYMETLREKPKDEDWTERLSLGFVLAMCCGHEDLALNLLQLGHESSDNGCTINVSNEGNLAANAASILNLPAVLDTTLSHSTYEPIAIQYDEYPKSAKLIDLDVLSTCVEEWNCHQEPSPKCQDAPPNLFVDPSKCKAIWFICHRWASKEHPDVDTLTGKINCQLNAVLKFLLDHRKKYCSGFRLRAMCPVQSRQGKELVCFTITSPSLNDLERGRKTPSSRMVCKKLILSPLKQIF